MLWVIQEMYLFLIVAGAVGGTIGWLMRGRRYHLTELPNLEASTGEQS